MPCPTEPLCFAEAGGITAGVGKDKRCLQLQHFAFLGSVSLHRMSRAHKMGLAQSYTGQVLGAKADSSRAATCTAMSRIEPWQIAACRRGACSAALCIMRSLGQHSP